MKSNSKNALVRKLSISGQVAEHKSEKLQEHGESEDAVLAALDEEERAQLDALLTKLQAAWQQDHREHHPRKEQ